MLCSSIKNIRWCLWLPLVLSMTSSGHGEDSVGEAATAKILMEFAQAANEPAWNAVNDGVMGGLSQGGAEIVGGLLHFSGTLSLENNGGFSSVRTYGSNFDLSRAKGMVLRVKGDGRTYQLRLSTDARYRGSRVSFGAEFTTKADAWIEVRIPFASLRPSYRGNMLEGPALNLAKVEEVGLLIGDGRAGEFALKVDWIKAE
jgi:monofunctional biosynthetic peptidoglycan transglycosylase